MVIYDVACRAGHRFEGWFQDLDAFKAQVAARQLTCPVCGDADVERVLTGSAIKRSAADRAGTVDTPAPAATPAAMPTREQVREFLSTLSAHVKANSDDVGDRFYEEARRIHHGLAPERTIRGSTTPEQEQKLVEEEIPFLKLPVVTNDD